ncbi:MAG: hypothetical protein ABI045_06115 [Flavobacteriales bacterium]
MKFSHVFLAAFLIMSCNDDKKNDKNKVEDLAEKDENKQFDCTTLKKECLVGNWKVKSAKLGENNQTMTDKTLTESQKSQNLNITNEKISGKILLVKAEEIELEDNPITLTDTDYTFVENDKKITFNKDQTTSIEVTIKAFKNKELTLEISGNTTNAHQAKHYVLETVWSKE